MSSALAARIAASAQARAIDPAVTAFAARLAAETGALAVLFYGSNLRTGSREGVLDYYVLLPGPPERGLWPRVAYREWAWEGDTLRAKTATMSMAMFERAARGDTIDTTIWARFVQPSALAFARDAAASARVHTALAQAVQTAARLAAVQGPRQGHEQDYWRALFRATYRAELRVEKPGREDSIIAANAAHFSGLLPLAWQAAGIGFEQDGDVLRPQLSPALRRDAARWWRKRRRLGKPLNIARLLRATRTFDGAARYAAWKIERHTGVAVPVTPWRERHPVLAAPGVLLKVWRAKRSG